MEISEFTVTVINNFKNSTFKFFFFTVKDTEMKRSKDAFKRVATLGGQMSDIVFCREVLGDGVPAGIANVSP